MTPDRAVRICEGLGVRSLRYSTNDRMPWHARELPARQMSWSACPEIPGMPASGLDTGR